jgi:stage II sporulation protein D
MRYKLFIKGFFFQLLLVFSLHGISQQVKVSLFNSHSVKTLVFSVVKGEYNVVSNGEFVAKLEKKDLVYLSLVEDFITLRAIDKDYGTYENLGFETFSDTAVFSIKPVLPSLKTRRYDDNVSFSVDYNRILMVNQVQLDKYLAGVVEAEGGPNALPEYYKAQSLLCRTYITKNMERHIEEGFNLCDEVHCQAFKGRSERNPEIIKATKATHGQVIIDNDSNLITAAFHANCGGQTTNSGSIWLVSKPYLVSVKDPYCAGKFNSSWERKIPAYKWKEYVKKKGFAVSLAAPAGDFAFYQTHRKEFYKIGKDSVSCNNIRTDWHLKSSFFSVIPSGNEFIIKGKGYGHGIGLCQDGAMNMAKAGKNYKEIVDFYYKGVRIIDLEE